MHPGPQHPSGARPYASVTIRGQVKLQRPQVKANTTAKTGYNDTPQNEDSGGFEDATHRTSFTKVTSDTATDGATPIERIDEIDRKIKNIMLEWCQEFKDLFWSE